MTFQANLNEVNNNIPSKNSILETRPVIQNQVGRRRTYRKYTKFSGNDNEDNENRIKNLPRQSIMDPLWNQFFNGSSFY